MNFLASKVSYSLEQIKYIDANYKNPLILCSFGKDSMVLLHLVRKLGLNWDVALHKFPSAPEKYAFADKIIQDWNLNMYDARAIKRSIVSGNGKVDVICHFSMGSGDYMVPIANLVESSDPEQDFCAADDLLNAECDIPENRFPYDICLAGVKSSDKDPVVGRISCDKNMRHTKDSADFAFPIRQWSDKDIFRYTITEDVPWQGTRYRWSADKKFVEREEKKFNPDYLDCCTRCLNPSEGKTVWCPKKNKHIVNTAFAEGIHRFKHDKIYLA